MPSISKALHTIYQRRLSAAQSNLRLYPVQSLVVHNSHRIVQAYSTCQKVTMNIPTLLLSDGNQIPLLAFGTGTTWFKDGANSKFEPMLVELIKTAIGKGFHHLDCAEMYGTEEEVGVAIKESGVPRDKLFITNKVAQGIDDIPAALEQSLRKLQVSYFDLYLIHIPFFAKTDADFQRAWRSMEEAKRQGKVRSIGVSNYMRPHIEATIKEASDPPVLNQLEYHPYLQRANNYVPWLREHGIELGSFKGLTPAFRCPEGPLLAPLARIAKNHATSENAVLLAWLIQQKVVAVTTTRSAERLDEYAQSLEIKLSQQEMQEITDVGNSYHFRTSWPEHFDPNDRS